MSRSVTTAGAFALAATLAISAVADAQDGEPADPVTSANDEVSDTLVAEDGSLAVYQKHIEVLNACDWVGLMAQYPNDVELHLGGGNVTVGREAIGAVFDGFVAPFPAGLCGLSFSEVSRKEVSGTQVVNWSADGDFLAEPYLGSDAYSSNGQYLDAFVSTFDGADLVYTEEAQAELDADLAEQAAMAEEEVTTEEADSMEEEVADEMDMSEEEAAALDEMNDDEEAIAEEIMEDEE